MTVNYAKLHAAPDEFCCVCGLGMYRHPEAGCGGCARVAAGVAPYCPVEKAGPQHDRGKVWCSWCLHGPPSTPPMGSRGLVGNHRTGRHVSKTEEKAGSGSSDDAVRALEGD